MNVTSTTISNKKACHKVINNNCCENIANSANTFKQLLANISNKLGLSKAIYQK